MLTPAEQARAQEIADRVRERMNNGEQNLVNSLHHLERMENEYIQSAQDVQEPLTAEPPAPLEGQEALPGFEPQEPEPLTADTVLYNTGRVSFKVDYMKSPEDALIAWEAPASTLKRYLKNHFEHLVQITAVEIGADPADIADKNRRTPEQQRKLTEIGAREAMARIEFFFTSKYYHALQVLDQEVGDFDDSNPHPASDYEKQEQASFIPLKVQAALYFFATHESISPIDGGMLTEEEQADLRAAFYKLDAFFAQYEEIKGQRLTEEDLPKAYRLFVEQEYPRPHSKYSQAEHGGAVMTIGGRLFVPSDPEYQNAFITSVKSNAGFYRRDVEKGTRQLATDINPTFMQALAKAVLMDIYNVKEGDTSVYFPAFAREIGYEMTRYTDGTEALTRADARERFINQKLAEWDSIWGVLPRSRTEYKLMALHTYNPDTEVFTFQSPYINQLLSGLIEKEESKLGGGDRFFIWQSELLHADAASDRNPAAVEMATRLLQGVQQRGMKPDAKLKQHRGRAFADEKLVTFSITCAGLVQDCPQIREKLKQQPDANRKTKLLKRAFPAMYKILTTKSDLFQYYKDLSITEVIPTAKSMSAVITISHHGGNPDYKRPFLPIKEEAPEEAQQQEAEK